MYGIPPEAVTGLKKLLTGSRDRRKRSKGRVVATARPSHGGIGIGAQDRARPADPEHAKDERSRRYRDPVVGLFVEAGGRGHGGDVLRQVGDHAGDERGRVGQASRGDWAVGDREGFFVEGLRPMSVDRRRLMIEPARPHLSIVRQPVYNVIN